MEYIRIKIGFRAIYIGFLGFLFLAVQQANGQQHVNQGLGLGFQINQFQQDFGFGVQVSSPSFWNEMAVLRFKTNLVFHQHLHQGQYEWSGYQNLTLGLVGYGGYVTENIRIYGEGGLIGLLPSTKFSNEKFLASGYGSFGTEFFSTPGFHFFLEIGVAPTRARADLMPGMPFYHNGFYTTMGLRSNLARRKNKLNP
ncbi:hypothetical protein [Shivajiella indica]|uniref:Acyloxyacyl hydrolase n=1 Tax=Shivajiella indica TaxID=872115 RepID=A0ABW5BFD6_9BACT